MPTLTDLRISPDVEEVLEGQGIAPERARPDIIVQARAVLEEAQALFDPAAMYAIVQVQDFHHKTVVLDGGLTFEGSLAARALAGAREVALAVCTIGPALEERVKELFTTHPVRAMALDGAGIAALRQVADKTIAQIREEGSARGWGTGMRAQPGQEGWSIQQQRVIFELVPADEIGVQLTDSCLMLPRKSVSFVVGMGPDMRPDAVACDFCSKRHRCPWRVSE